MSLLALANETNVELGFLEACVDVPYPAMTSVSSISPNTSANNSLASYKATFTDFYGYDTPCIYKTGPAWPIAQGQFENLVRAARPIYQHDIAPTWLQTLWSIVAFLDSLKVPLKWNTIDPLAYGNAGQAELFCEFIVVISVNPGSLPFEVAKATAEAVYGLISVSSKTCARVEVLRVFILTPGYRLP